MAALSFGQLLAQAKRQQREALKLNPVWQQPEDIEKAERKAELDRDREQKKKELEAEAERKLLAKQAKDKVAAKKNRDGRDFMDDLPANAGHFKTQSRGKLPNRPLNLDQLIPVKVDSKTTVYVKPGSDIEAVKAKYKRQTYDRFDDLPPTYQF